MTVKLRGRRLETGVSCSLCVCWVIAGFSSCLQCSTLNLSVCLHVVLRWTGHWSCRHPAVTLPSSRDNWDRLRLTLNDLANHKSPANITKTSFHLPWILDGQGMCKVNGFQVQNQLLQCISRPNYSHSDLSDWLLSHPLSPSRSLYPFFISSSARKAKVDDCPLVSESVAPCLLWSVSLGSRLIMLSALRRLWLWLTTL